MSGGTGSCARGHDQGERELAREVLGEVVDSAVVKQTSLKCNLGSEARLLGSMLEVQVWEWVEDFQTGT